MQFVSKAKIGRLSAKCIEYPQLRLPREYSSIVGETADIFATEHEGKQAFLNYLIEFYNDDKPRYFVPEVNSSFDDLQSIVNDFINAGADLLILDSLESLRRRRKILFVSTGTLMYFDR